MLTLYIEIVEGSGEGHCSWQDDTYYKYVTYASLQSFEVLDIF